MTYALVIYEDEPIFVEGDWKPIFSVMMFVKTPSTIPEVPQLWMRVYGGKKINFLFGEYESPEEILITAKMRLEGDVEEAWLTSDSLAGRTLRHKNVIDDFSKIEVDGEKMRRID